MLDDEWTAWVDQLNGLAGLTLVVIATCQDCRRVYPASPRQRVWRCPPCRERVIRICPRIRSDGGGRL